MKPNIEVNVCKSPNDPKLSDGGGRQPGCGDTDGVAAAVGAAGMTTVAVRCSAWLGDDLFGSSIAISGSKDGQECMEELGSRRIDELMDLGVFRKEWQRVFGDEVGMLVKESLRVKPHDRSGLASDIVENRLK